MAVLLIPLSVLLTLAAAVFLGVHLLKRRTR